MKRIKNKETYKKRGVQRLTGWQFSVHLDHVPCSLQLQFPCHLEPGTNRTTFWKNGNYIVITSLSTSVSELHLVPKKNAIQRNTLKGCKTLKSCLSGEARSASADAPSNHWLCDAALLLGLSTKKLFIINVFTSSGQHSDRKIGMLTNI